MESYQLKIGVLALQGAVEKHIEMVERCSVSAIRLRFAEELDQVHGLIIPGGESTTVGKLMARYGIDKKIIQRAGQGMPIFGTCTGMILLSKEVLDSDQHRLGLINMMVQRNAFGRQIDSFEADLTIAAVGAPEFRAVFIRAPYAVKVDENVKTLATCEDKMVFVKQGNFLGCAFHPELTNDKRIHEYFIELVKNSLPEQLSYQRK